jgi:ketosteroid isomerase-like protein
VSHENTPRDLEAISRIQIDAVNRRDIDAAMRFAATDFVYDTSPSGLGVYEGHEAVKAFITEYWAAFDELRFELEELVNLGHGIVLSIQRQHARPVGSSATVEAREAHVIEWVASKVKRITVYIDIDAARGAAHRLAASKE